MRLVSVIDSDGSSTPIRRTQMIRFWNKRLKMGGQRGFTLIELMKIGRASCRERALTMLLYANVQRRARIAKAQADARSIASAISIYSAHMGTIPGTQSH